jgi:hypothetical protein
VDLFPDNTVRPGDVIEIYGTRFNLLAGANRSTTVVNGYFRVAAGNMPMFLAQPLNDSGQQMVPRYDDAGFEIAGQNSSSKPAAPYWTYPSPYKILRQPTPASDEPYQLPEGTAIDLRASGVGSDDYFYVQGTYDNSDGVIIMFAPEGRVSRVSFNRMPLTEEPFDKPVVNNVFLLVGRRENNPPAAEQDPTLQSATVAAATTDEQRAKLREPINWLGGNSRWIVIGSQSGRIATIDNAFVDMAGIIGQYSTLSQGSEELRNQQILAAREFTREMGQLGGR